ncbi:MAG: DNA methyltransferase [Solirubrobacterales bacterium]
MTLREIEERVAALKSLDGGEFLFELLRAYGIPKASITRLRTGSYNRSEQEGEYLWREKVYFRSLDCPDEELYALVDAARTEERVRRERPRFVIARNRSKLVAADLRTGDALDIEVDELQNHAAFFLPWARIEKTQIENRNLADVKAAEKMAKLYDEIVKHNAVEVEEQIHDLNAFFSRLLFCFFAEDTGVFEKGSFTNAVGSLSREDGKDLHELLDQVFDVLNTEESKRIGYPSHLLGFGFVNGKLFERHSSAPRFTAKARALVLDCGTLDWSQINPDIFGSMMQAVVHPGQRESLGMHYTSVENIMKVIRPLFLDELQAAFDSADTMAKLTRLRDRITSIKCFDPACGSGNFLVIAYKELRKLEHRILKRLQEIDPGAPLTLFQDSEIKLENFCGIEIDDFAHEVAILSLWLAKHQMNVEFRDLFSHEIRLIPLRDAGNVICANAARVDWDEVCPVNDEDEVYLLSNPPYLGARVQDASQKSDLQYLSHFGAISNNLDYVAIWFLLGADYVGRHEAALGFVSTNSICQGDQVALLWPHVYSLGADISFGVQSFRWSNNAKGNAGVTCVIVGLRRDGNFPRRLYTGAFSQEVDLISPYLTKSHRRVIVEKQSTPISPSLPPLVFGSMPNDGGHLLLRPDERAELLQKAPAAEPFIRRFLGADEFLKGQDRYALWITSDEVATASSIADIADRIERVADYRLSSKREATRRLANMAYRFAEVRHRDSNAIIVPSVSSERREYIPVGFLDGSTVISNLAFAIYGAEPWLFALVSSRMHNVWVRAVAGALETRIRYSATLCYNTFPVPPLPTKQRELLSERAFAVLEAREHHSHRSLAQLYDPEKMPGELREAHQFLDAAVDQLYRKRPFQTDDERLELLFDMYESATSGGGTKPEARKETAGA